MESLPLLAAASGSAAGDCPPAAACAENPSYAAAGAACSMYEESRKASVDAPLDITGMLASPAPVTAAGDLLPPSNQAEPQPLSQQPQQQQASEQAKSAAAPVDPYQYLLALSNFPSPRPGLQGGVGGANGRGDEASGNVAGDFATAYLNQASAPGAAAGSTMMELAYAADAAGHLKEGMDASLLLATHGSGGMEHTHSAFPLATPAAEQHPYQYSYHLQQQQHQQQQQQQNQQQTSSYSYLQQPYYGQPQQQQQQQQQPFHQAQQQQQYQPHYQPQQQHQQQQHQQLSEAAPYLPQMDHFFYMETYPNTAGAAGGQTHYTQQQQHQQQHQQQQQYQQQPYQQQDASTSTSNNGGRIVMPSSSCSSHPYPLYQHHHQQHQHHQQQQQQQQQQPYTLEAELNPATSPTSYPHPYHHVNTTDYSHPHTSSSCSTSVTSCTTNGASSLRDDEGAEGVGSSGSSSSSSSSSNSGNGGGGGLHVHTTEDGGAQFALSAGMEALMGLSERISSPSMTSSDEDDEELPHHRFLPVAFGIPGLPSQMWCAGAIASAAAVAAVAAPAAGIDCCSSSSSSSGSGLPDVSRAGARLRRNAAVAAAAALAADISGRSRRSLTGSMSSSTRCSTRSSSSSIQSKRSSSSSSPSGAASLLPPRSTTTSTTGGGGGYKPPSGPIDRRGRRKYSLDSANFVIVPTPKILPGSLHAKRPNRLCRTPACGNRYRTPGYLCETCGGGRCQVKGCGRLHQGKQGLPDLFFCRAHRNVYALLLRKEDGEGVRVEEQQEEQEQEQEQEMNV